jgi:hypothetical protein
MENIKEKVQRGVRNERGKDIVFPYYCFIGGKEKRKKQECEDYILLLFKQYKASIKVNFHKLLQTT